MYVHKHENI